jgi:ABC-type methionine transport system ATPase subunit
MGTSGSGKSTLLEICAGLHMPSTGRVVWDGKDIRELSQAALVAERRKMGFVFQQHGLISNLTVFENIALPLRYHTSLQDQALHAMIEQHCKKFGIEDFRDRLPETLSVGQARLVAIARALIMRPECLFLDEPINGLDPVIADTIITILLKLSNQRNLTFFVVSHTISFIEQLQGPVLFLDKGTLVPYENLEQFRNAENTHGFASFLRGDRNK